MIFKHTKEIIMLLLTLAVVIKILLLDFNSFKLPENLTDIISLVLALFSVGLSALFYFKANEASNQFYDNTYQFTKDISEKIGRIEERFGKDLDNIDKNYSRMLDKIDRLPITESLQKEIEQTASSEKQIIEEKEKIIAELINKSDISKDEKEMISVQLHQKDKELETVKSQLIDLRNQLEQSNFDKNYFVPPHTRNLLIRIIKGVINRNEIPEDFNAFIELIERRISALNDKDIKLLIIEGIIDSNIKVSLSGKRIIRSLSREFS
ncbi:hypothetical protein [Paenibacillus alvei]|uniref:hypothetical protein n=1 Tax=Paenibacillus alvei TaxID=44250 RepID=UPI00038552B6|nr:hypothetical protein [Paenibacillus alvei]EPY12125.1 hypothetical protein PAAL66ix_14546 [Paenibacillus alvei A6-6i-x]